MFPRQTHFAIILLTKMFLLWAILVAFLASVNATFIGVSGALLCSDPYSNVASIFLMERDFGRTIFDSVDDDDVLAYKEIGLNEPFELGGEEVEINGLEPYIYIRHSCKKGYQEEVINLGDTQFKDRMYYLRKDLDTGKTILH
ncbi:unnamed protein product [Strongylus vulgaris]|uniref:Transthyretin/hydroxyisourate hydrolase domain-containing protein n=1 Tax=Strongylus vulgaris TaxID=40348 RepID=A0A3P7IPG5_STRVU|nr:unnamed protein product [Strongylus vulgaris]